MGNWFRRLRAAAFLGIVWALAWGIVGGGVMEGIFDPHGKIFDMWPQALAIPGFLSGMIFSGLLAVGERRRSFAELSMPRFAGWGAMTGLALGALVLGLGLAAGAPLWMRLAAIVAPLTVLSAGSAFGTLALARVAEKRLLPRGHAGDQG